MSGRKDRKENGADALTGMDMTILDKRVVEYYIRMGVLTREQYERYLEQLPDVSHLADEKGTLPELPSWKRRGKGDTTEPSAEEGR
jgi:hypothetical protein